MIATVWTTAAELPFDPSFRTVLEPNVLETQMITTVLVSIILFFFWRSCVLAQVRGESA
jgi:hypothetical protein